MSFGVIILYAFLPLAWNLISLGKNGWFGCVRLFCVYSLEIIFVICNGKTEDIISSFITQLVFLSLKIAVVLIKCIFMEGVSPSIRGC